MINSLGNENNKKQVLHGGEIPLLKHIMSRRTDFIMIINTPQACSGEPAVTKGVKYSTTMGGLGMYHSSSLHPNYHDCLRNRQTIFFKRMTGK